MAEKILIDGNYLEGGGQIVRTALALSTITKKGFIVDNIRRNRPEQGLKNQHLYCIKALEELCGVSADGAELGSTRLEFESRKILPKNLNIDIGTAGSVSLVLQSVLLPCMFSEKRVHIKIHGGTDTSWSIPFNFFSEIILPQIRRYCEKIDAKLISRGYYPKGGGYIEIVIAPRFFAEKFLSYHDFISAVKNAVPKINLVEQGNLIHIKGISYASMDLQDAQVAERQASSAKSYLSKLGYPVNIRLEYSDTLSTGSGIVLWAVFSKNKDDVDFMNPIVLGADSLGEKGKRAEIVGKEAAEKLEKEIISKAPVDSHTADNLIPFIGLFGGAIMVSEITNHTLTNIYTAERFLGNVFKVDNERKIISAD